MKHLAESSARERALSVDVSGFIGLIVFWV